MNKQICFFVSSECPIRLIHTININHDKSRKREIHAESNQQQQKRGKKRKETLQGETLNISLEMIKISVPKGMFLNFFFSSRFQKASWAY